MPNYEYCIVDALGPTDINELGRQGWRLTETLPDPLGRPSYHVMEREIQPIIQRLKSLNIESFTVDMQSGMITLIPSVQEWTMMEPILAHHNGMLALLVNLKGNG